MPNADKNLITETELAILAEKLALAHRSEDDWAKVKEIFSDRSIIVMTPQSKKIPHRGPMTLYQGNLTAFTTSEKCVAHIQATAPKENFLISAMPFLDAADFAERQGLRLYIDVTTIGPFYCYRRNEMAVSRFF